MSTHCTAEFCLPTGQFLVSEPFLVSAFLVTIICFFQSLSNSLSEEGRTPSEANTENYGDTLVAIATALRGVL